jgi:hypothetical protein
VDPNRIVTRATISKTARVAMVSSLGLQATFTKASTRKMKEMATAKCTGQTAVATRENGSAEFNMDMGG